MNLFFSVKGQKLSRINNEKIAGFSRNYIHAIFNFDKVWINLLKYAIFTEPNGTKHVVNLGYGKTLQCRIPDDVLKNTFFKVSVFADDLLTSTDETIIVSPSGYVSEIDDLEEGDSIEGKSEYDYIPWENFDEYFNERKDYFERAEHPYV